MLKEKNLLSFRYSANFKAFERIKTNLNREAKEALFEIKEKISKREISLNSRQTCPLCGHKYAYLIAEKDRLGLSCDTVICKSCGLVFNDSYLNEESVDIFYKDYWGRIQWPGDPRDNFKHRILPEAYAWKRFAYLCLTIGQENLKDIKLVFEIGCGDGCNLVPFIFSGKKAIGCDLDLNFLDVGRHWGLDLRLGHTEILKENNGKADLIILSHVFEHFTDLDKEIENIKNIIKPGGYVYVEVPGLIYLNRCRSQSLSEGGYSSSNNFLMYLQFPHNYHFDLYHLEAFWDRHGFKLVSGDEWVRAVFQYQGSKKYGSELNHQIQNETNEKESIEPEIFRPKAKILEHLSRVERDFISLSGQTYRILGKLGRRLGV